MEEKISPTRQKNKRVESPNLKHKEQPLKKPKKVEKDESDQ